MKAHILIQPKHPFFKSTICSVNGKRYKYGFNGQEKDNEIAGEGNINTAMFWEYDTRLGRRWNLDPVVKHHKSPFACFYNTPIYLNDPDGDDPPKFTGNNKEKRSVNKYSRKLERLKKKEPDLHSDDKYHEKMEIKYNNKRWMWIKQKGDLNGTSADKTGQIFFHAGDIYRNLNEKKVETVESDLDPVSVNILAAGAIGSPIYRSYQVPSDGSVSFVPTATGTSSYNFSFSQGNSETVDLSGGATFNPSSLFGPVTINSSNSGTITVNFNVSVSGGNYLYLFISINSGGASSESNIPQIKIVTSNITTLKVNYYISPTSKNNKKNHKLNLKTRKTLNDQRKHIKR